MAGLRMPADQLKSRIERRVHEMYRHGLFEEVERLIAQHGALSATAAQAIGYAEVIACLEGRISREQAAERTAMRTRRLAKRQATWFRHQATVVWIDIRDDTPAAATAQRVMAHWSKHGPTLIEEGEFDGRRADA